MNYQEAMDKLEVVPWTILECDTKDCWCAGIGSVEPIPCEETACDVYVCPSGSIPRKLAELIVKEHNNTLRGEKQI
jgi:hypothetical protein